MKRSLAIMAVLIVLVSAFYIYKKIVYKQRIKEVGIHARVTSIIQDDSRLKIYYYESNAGLRLRFTEDISIGYNNFIYNDTFHITNELAVRDSLVKAPGDLALAVYRKDASGKYQLLKTLKADL